MTTSPQLPYHLTTGNISSAVATPTLPPIEAQPIVSSLSHTHIWNSKSHFPLIPTQTDAVPGWVGPPRNVWKRRNSDIECTTKLSHYQHIKGLIESRHDRQPHPQLIESHRRDSMVRQPHPQLSVHSGHPRPPNVPGLTPELTKYISEIWRKHVGQF